MGVYDEELAATAKRLLDPLSTQFERATAVFHELGHSPHAVPNPDLVIRWGQVEAWIALHEPSGLDEELLKLILRAARRHRDKLTFSEFLARCGPDGLPPWAERVETAS